MNARNFDTDSENSPKQWNLGCMQEELLIVDPSMKSRDWSQFFIYHTYETHFINSKRGKVHIWWFKLAQAYKTVIMFPGSRLNNKSSTGLLVAGMFIKMGLNVVMAEYLDHGESSTDDKKRNFGFYEKYDAFAVWDYILERNVKEESLIVYGQSMGGSLALILSQYRKCKIVIADSSPTNEEGLIQNVYQYAGLSFLYPICGSLTNFHIKRYNASLIDIIPSPYCKYVIIYNSHDPFIIHKNHSSVFNNKSLDVRLEYFEGGHMHGPFLETSRYYDLLHSNV